MPWMPILFTILSPPNFYGRVVVGDSSGEIFTLGNKALQDLINDKLIQRPLRGGDIETRGDMHFSVSIGEDLRARKITFWSQPLLGIGTICAYEWRNQKWYLWLMD